MDPVQLQQELLEFLIMVQNLNPVQLKDLCQFVSQNTNSQSESLFGQLQQALQRATSQQLEELVALSTVTLGGPNQAQFAVSYLGLIDLIVVIWNGYLDILPQ